jgi:hypothetical protein
LFGGQSSVVVFCLGETWELVLTNDSNSWNLSKAGTMHQGSSVKCYPANSIDQLNTFESKGSSFLFVDHFVHKSICFWIFCRNCSAFLLPHRLPAISILIVNFLIWFCAGARFEHRRARVVECFDCMYSR